MQNKLDSLRNMTVVVADTGDINAIRQWQPQDATTNPSLILKATSSPDYEPLMLQAIEKARADGGSEQQMLDNATDHLGVTIGREILRYIPGRISTEVDARLSFDTLATVERAKKLIDLYESSDISRERVLIKIASTWEGIRAAEILQKENINCNLTLLFGFHQAVAAGDAGAYLISPFVGRILDWYKATTGIAHYAPDEDPGVLSVKRIYDHYKKYGYQTVVMGASFRNTGEIEALAGCDRLTISPDLMSQLSEDNNPLTRKLSPTTEQAAKDRPLTESSFRWHLNEDAMATEKLAEGIRKFAADQIELENKLKALKV